MEHNTVFSSCVDIADNGPQISSPRWCDSSHTDCDQFAHLNETRWFTGQGVVQVHFSGHAVLVQLFG